MNCDDVRDGDFKFTLDPTRAAEDADFANSDDDDDDDDDHDDNNDDDACIVVLSNDEEESKLFAPTPGDAPAETDNKEEEVEVVEEGDDACAWRSPRAFLFVDADRDLL